MDIPGGRGVAFDTNMLARPTQRRLMTLWCELAGMRAAVLPQVLLELTAQPTFEPQAIAPSAHAQRAAWIELVRAPLSPFEAIVLDERAQALFGRIIMEFTLPCFPLLNGVDEITTHPDAVVLAQGLAAGMDVIVSNNMRSIDHFEINGLVREVFGRNAGLLIAADAALLDAHAYGEGSRALLVMALAAAWPDDGRHMATADADVVLGELCGRLEGATMPQTAARLRSRFASEQDLPAVLGEAREMSAGSNALRHERVRMAWVKRREVDVADLPAAAGSPARSRTGA